MGLNLQSGDRVLHPTFGLGVVEGLTTRHQAGQKVECYQIRLPEGSVLTVPMARAEVVGLRLITNNVASIVAGLHSSPQSLPDDDRQRFVELRARSQAPEATALIQAMRDLLNYGRSNKLTPADKKWLGSACEHLSAEAAWVDRIDLDQARATIQHEMDQFKPPESVDAALANKKRKAGKTK